MTNKIVYLVHSGADSLVSVTDDTGQCALVHAARGGHLDLVRTLLTFVWAPPKVENCFQIGTPSNGDEPIIVEKTGIDKTQAKHQALVAAASKVQTQFVLLNGTPLISTRTLGSSFILF